MRQSCLALVEQDVGQHSLRVMAGMMVDVMSGTTAGVMYHVETETPAVAGARGLTKGVQAGPPLVVSKQWCIDTPCLNPHRQSNVASPSACAIGCMPTEQSWYVPFEFPSRSYWEGSSTSFSPHVECSKLCGTPVNKLISLMQLELGMPVRPSNGGLVFGLGCLAPVTTLYKWMKRAGEFIPKGFHRRQRRCRIPQRAESASCYVWIQSQELQPINEMSTDLDSRAQPSRHHRNHRTSVISSCLSSAAVLGSFGFGVFFDGNFMLSDPPLLPNLPFLVLSPCFSQFILLSSFVTFTRFLFGGVALSVSIVSVSCFAYV
jgi:hypothetical protein